MSDRRLQTAEDISLVGMTSHSWRDLIHTFVASNRAQRLKPWQGQTARRGNVRVLMQAVSGSTF